MKRKIWEMSVMKMVVVMIIFCFCSLKVNAGTNKVFNEEPKELEDVAVDVKMIEKRLHEILTAIIKDNSGNWLQFFTEDYKRKYYQACKRAEREGLEYPRIWWQESEDDPNQFVIKSSKIISGEKVCSVVVLKGELLIGVFELKLKKEFGIWVIDEVTQKELTTFPASAQTSSNNDFLTIREAMDIVSYRRYHPLTDGDMDDLIKSTAQKYGYIDKDFLEGVGTCSFWQYIKNGYVVYDTAPDDHFVPDNKQTAAAFAVVDCQGIESINGDEIAISVDMRVFSESNFEILLKEMQEIGFRYNKTENGLREYAWKTYRVYIHKSKTRGHDCWFFEVMLEERTYDTTKNVEFSDSTRAHDLCITLDYPVKGDPVLLRRIRTFMMEAIEPGITVDQIIPRFNGDQTDGQALVNYYGRKRCACLDKDYYDNSPLPFTHCIEGIRVEVVGENDHFISFEVFRYGNCGGSSNYLVYGATFRKSDGRRMHVIANPQDPKYKQFLNKDLYFDNLDNKDALLEEYREQIPLPEYEPYLIQNGVRFVYQQSEIAVRPAGFLKADEPFSVVRDFLTEEVKELLK